MKLRVYLDMTVLSAVEDARDVVMEYFDYGSAGREARMTPEQLEQLRQVVARDYPNDAMLLELHMLRACRAIRDGHVSLAELLTPPRPPDAGVGRMRRSCDGEAHKQQIM